MNINVSVSCTSQPPFCHPRTFVKYVPTPPALGVCTEAAICLVLYFHILTFLWMGHSQQRSKNLTCFVGFGIEILAVFYMSKVPRQCPMYLLSNMIFLG